MSRMSRPLLQIIMPLFDPSIKPFDLLDVALGRSLIRRVLVVLPETGVHIVCAIYEGDLVCSPRFVIPDLCWV